ncbi:MAG: family NAD(P)-dependent oxidoreductase [Leifsonia sp.]|jgi:NAD(P)-dependent dehydrogenase (short-subunit alcohol dehydrogenase family)|nr:family NAD(P)-dependent oxidoreductase [Leifsonia sp.]
MTGGSSGIGAESAARLAEQGAELAIVGRNPERTRAVADRVGGTPFLADYDHLDDVHALADALLARYDTIDVLANNAGGVVSRHAITVDGHERAIQSNHLAPFLLTNLLLPRLIASASGGSRVRVVSLASSANLMGDLRLDDLNWEKRPWLGGWRAYGTSKVATILFIRELAERLTGTSVDAYSMHPGLVVTRFGDTSPAMRVARWVTRGHYGIPVAAGAIPLTALAGAADVGAPSGTYFDRLTPNGRVNPQAKDAQLGRDLWALSERLVGLGSHQRG